MADKEEEKSEWEDILVPLPGKICPKCSKKYPLTEKYCSECGTNLIEENELGKYRKTEEYLKQYDFLVKALRESGLEAEYNARKVELERKLISTKADYQKWKSLRSELEDLELAYRDVKDPNNTMLCRHCGMNLIPVMRQYPNLKNCPECNTAIFEDTEKPGEKTGLLKKFITAAIAAIIIFAGVFFAMRNPANKYKVGDKITFGSWPVGIEGETAQSIEWEILEKKNDGTAVVLSSKVIDAKPYNTEIKDITWAESSLRTWLNGEFYSKAFTAKEKDAIVETTLKNADNIGEISQAYIDWLKKWGLYDEGDEEKFLGKRMNGKGGVDTTDNVWLLSLDDMKRYGRRFSTDASRIGKPMEYLKKKWNFCSSDDDDCKRNGAVGNAWWWLRSPGYSQRDAAYVHYGGFVDANGSFVVLKSGGVRAALKINLNNL